MKIDRMKELIEILNRASKLYYQGDTELMSNKEYDALYDELVGLETQTGTVLSSSPTVHVGYEVLSELPKKEHPSPMLSLNKTKEVSELKSFLGEKEGLLSWKLDGLTVVLTYEEGELVEAVTRGNGSIGEVIYENAKTFKNLPLKIPYRGRLVLRGEAVISYKDFETINEALPVNEVHYKNPRNLCSGSVRQLNPQITASRRVNFYAFALVEAGDEKFGNSHKNEFDFIKSLGFESVEFKVVNADNIEKAVDEFFRNIKGYDLPSDGLVLIYDDIDYGASLGSTAKFPRDAIAFKWTDEIATTILSEVLWSPSRTGLINPIAVFEPVEIEGTTVSRASLHNVSIFESLNLGIGDEITVYKANMIIPQVDTNLTRSNTLAVPKVCPKCGHDTIVLQKYDSRELYCNNPDCPVKLIKQMEHFVSRNCMNIEGLSIKKLEALTEAGLLDDVVDIYKLVERRNEVISLERFGEKTFANLVQSIEESKDVKVANFINALGIEGVGLQASKSISEYFDGDLKKIIKADLENLLNIDKIGDIIAGNFIDYMSDEQNIERIKYFMEVLRLKKLEVKVDSVLSKKVFVITGKLESYANRNELKAVLEGLGAVVSSTVSSNTDFLVNNDVNSLSSKNKKAKSLGVQIISENEVNEMIHQVDRW